MSIREQLTEQYIWENEQLIISTEKKSGYILKEYLQSFVDLCYKSKKKTTFLIENKGYVSLCKWNYKQNYGILPLFSQCYKPTVSLRDT